MLIKAMITAYSAAVRRRRAAIVFDALIRYVAVAPRQSAGLRESPVMMHVDNRLRYPSLQAPDASTVTAWYLSNDMPGR